MNLQCEVFLRYGVMSVEASLHATTCREYTDTPTTQAASSVHYEIEQNVLTSQKSSLQMLIKMCCWNDLKWQMFAQTCAEGRSTLGISLRSWKLDATGAAKKPLNRMKKSSYLTWFPQRMVRRDGAQRMQRHELMSAILFFIRRYHQVHTCGFVSQQLLDGLR